MQNPSATAPTSAPDASLEVSSPARSLRISWPHVVLSLIGFGISCYALIVHFRLKRGDGGCGFSDSCDAVIGSKYGEIFHIPLGAFGMTFFVLVLLTAISTAPMTVSNGRLALQRLAVASIGLLSSLGLAYISLFKLHKVCPVCTATHVTTLLVFLVSLFGFWKALRNPNSAAD